MKRTILLLLVGVAVLTAGCREEPPVVFTDVVSLPYTPVKNQGRDPLCWAYAMLATIETEHICRGDSVHLSPYYIRRLVGKGRQRGMGHTLIHFIERKGIVPFDTYPDTTHDALPVPQQVFMLGARYTPQEFAHSVCAPDEYVALTSDPTQPYGQMVVADYPDNWERNTFLNLPQDSLVAVALRALRHRHPVCWEGDTSNRGFSFRQGIAHRALTRRPNDNHCMAIVGLSRHPDGRLFFKLKNSWGTDNPYGGLVYMSQEYLRTCTVALYLTRDAYLGL